MALKGWAAAFLVPPVSFALYALIGLILAGNPRRRWARGLALASTIALVLCSLPVVSRALLASLSAGLELAPPVSDPPQAIVILSGDLGHSVAPFPGLDVGHLTLERLRAGAALYRRTHLPVLVSGGPFRGRNTPLAALMAQSLSTDFATPVRWLELRSQDTWENAAFSAAILKAEGVRSVYLVTHSMHMRRSLMAFRRFGLIAIPAPVRLDPWPSFTPDELVPSANAWIDSYYGFHEWLGCAYYALR